MKRKPVEELIYEYMFPKPRQSDPTNFQNFLARNLIPEVRQEVHCFYGHIDTLEAKYPGLDYNHPTHRIRLSRLSWHRRLFRAFDGLRLTHNEIAKLTKWEGTLWAKERFEKEQGAPIKDTVEDEIGVFIEPEDRTFRLPPALETPRAVSDEPEGMDARLDDEDDEDLGGNVEEDEESDDAMESVGPTLNERLREQVARREAGDSAAILDEEWEQWLKNALETGGFPDVAQAIFQGRWVNAATLVPALEHFPPEMLSAARAGRWDDVPDRLEPMLRRALLTEEAQSAPTRADDAFWAEGEEVGRGGYRRYSDLRLPGSRSSLRRVAVAREG